jgi:Protein of unknown function (DUF4197)
VTVARRPLSQLVALVCAVGLGLAGAGCADLSAAVAPGSALPEQTIAAGLREALRVGAERSVSRASRPGGFLDDPRVRTPLPPALEKIGLGLRAEGQNGAVDDLEQAMNRAAEHAAGGAQTPLVAAIASLEIADARAVLAGPKDAATQVLRRESGAALRERLAPIVAAAMREARVSRAYDELCSRNRALDLLADPTVDLSAYVTDETLRGLFTLIADEEQRIRRSPVARTTELLRAVFGEP